LWFGGPIPYPDSGLSASLIRDLQAWEQSYYDALTPDFEWKSASAADDFSAEGATLAQRLAGELGSGYEVELRTGRPHARPVRFRAAATGANSRAVRAFDQLVATAGISSAGAHGSG